MDDLAKIREIQEIQFGDQWYQRFWGSFEAAQEEERQFSRRELIRQQAPCLHLELEKAIKYWRDNFEKEGVLTCDYEEFASRTDEIFNDGCWCPKCRRFEPLGIMQKIRTIFSIPAQRQLKILNARPVLNNLTNPKIAKLLNTYDKLNGSGPCPFCKNLIKLEIPDTKLCAKEFTCDQCNKTYRMEKAINACL